MYDERKVEIAKYNFVTTVAQNLNMFKSFETSYMNPSKGIMLIHCFETGFNFIMKVSEVSSDIAISKDFFNSCYENDMIKSFAQNFCNVVSLWKGFSCELKTNEKNEGKLILSFNNDTFIIKTENVGTGSSTEAFDRNFYIFK